MQFSCVENREICGRDFTVILYAGKEYLIGVQIAHFLKRETFNLYRSMKLNAIDVVKCDPEQVEELAQLEAVKRGIHSVTLIPVDDGIAYINREVKRKPRKKSDKKRRHQHRLMEVGDLSVSRILPSTPLSVGTRSSLAAAVTDAAKNMSNLRIGQHLEVSGLNSCSDDDDSVSTGYSAAEESAGTSGSEEQTALWSRLLMIAAREHLRECAGCASGPTQPLPAELCV